MAEIIKYKRIKKGKYKFELLETYSCRHNLPGNISCRIKDYITVFRGIIYAYIRYQWDGATGLPEKLSILWEKWFIRGSLIHDCFYQLFREGLLDLKYRKDVDTLMYNMFVEDNMPVGLAWSLYCIVRGLGWIFVKGEKTNGK